MKKNDKKELYYSFALIHIMRKSCVIWAEQMRALAIGFVVRLPCILMT